jgi:hypothetical protein
VLVALVLVVVLLLVQQRFRLDLVVVVETPLMALDQVVPVRAV